MDAYNVTSHDAILLLLCLLFSLAPLDSVENKKKLFLIAVGNLN